MFLSDESSVARRRARAVMSAAIGVWAARCLDACVMSPYGQPIQAQQGVGQQIYVQPSGAGQTQFPSGPPQGGNASTSFPSSPPQGGYTPTSSTNFPPATGGYGGGDPLSPPYFGRIFVGRIPFEENSLTSNVHGGNEQYVEYWFDGRPASVLINGQQSTQMVTRGDHRGRMAQVLPPRQWGRTMFDGPGQHGIEFWCYLDVPGVGLIQMDHGVRQWSGWPIQVCP